MARSSGWRITPILASLAFLLSQCSLSQSQPVPTPPAVSSGIEGITEADPQCPIVTPGAVCPPKPLSRTIAVLDPAGTEVTRFTSDANGLFRIGLLPGAYQLAEVVDPPGSPPSLKPIGITVLPGTFAHVALLFDTGIR